MKMTLEGGFTLQRHLHRQMARWITMAGVWGWAARRGGRLHFFFLPFSFFIFNRLHTTVDVDVPMRLITFAGNTECGGAIN